MVPIRGQRKMRQRSVRLHFVGKVLIVCAVILASLSAGAQTSSKREPQPVVSDWTHHHVLFPDSKDASLMSQLQGDPRWRQSWLLRHNQNSWPGIHGRRHWRGVGRDWSVPLGTAYYEPLFDSSFTFSIGAQAGFGFLTSADLGGGQFLATAGVLSVTAGSNLGNYALYPGGAGTTTSPGGAFQFDNVIFPLQNPTLDNFGVLFLGGGLEINIWGNAVPDNYTFYAWDGANYITTVTDPAGSVTPALAAAPDPGGGLVFPAKFAFDVNQPPSCTSDFVVVGIPTNRAVVSQANIIGFNNLYSNAGGTGLCPTTGPTVMFAYTSGIGQVPASVVISQSGQQVAYIENVPGNSFFHVLTIGTTGTNGTGATSPVAPGSGNNALDVRVRLTPDGGTTNQSSTNAPFVVFTPNDSADVAYATTYDLSAGTGYLYKLDNVFNGSATPTIVWSVPITAVPSAPTYDRLSNKIFFTDSAGRIDYVVDSGIPPTVVYGSVVALGSTSENAVLIDVTHQMVYAGFNTDGMNAVIVQAPETLASSVSVAVGTGDTTYTGPYLPDFNHAWYSGSGTPMMFVAGTGTGTLPTLYGVGFTGGVMNTSASSSTALATGSADSSPVTEFYNSSLLKDLLFVGVSDNCVATTQGGTAGCVMSLDITNGFPTVDANTTALAASGGTTGIIPDNNSNLPEASSIYYATKNGSTLVKATQSALQ